MSSLLPCVLFEDEHLLAINKPAGLNTHAPAPFAGEGIYDWLRHREPHWASLAIVHRLDKETSGVLVFSKTPLANRSLTRQFTERTVHKNYLLLTDRPVPPDSVIVRSCLVRLGDRYVSRPAPGPQAETQFRVVESDAGRHTLVEAEPVTGRTHQIRVHAADQGFPILGDALYGGSPFQRLCLHAKSLTLMHPATGLEVTFLAKPDFALDARTALREALFDATLTNACRLAHGDSDRHPGWYVERLGEFILSTSERSSLSEENLSRLRWWMERYCCRGVYHKRLVSQPAEARAGSVSPQHLLGESALDEFVVLENGVRFGLSFQEGYSVGLFLDQRDNRRRLLTNHVASGFDRLLAPKAAEVLNVFAYTCAFSVCAARSGARTTSLDLSRKYLEWGQRNFRLNELDPNDHDFIYGDAFDWLKRLRKKKRLFDLILLDPPTFSRSKEHGVFRVETDYPRLVTAALPLLKSRGILFASTNSARLKPEAFGEAVTSAIRGCGRRISHQHYVPQPLDFPISRGEPAYLKTIWTRVD